MCFLSAGDQGDRGDRGPTTRGPKGEPGAPGLPGKLQLWLRYAILEQCPQLLTLGHVNQTLSTIKGMAGKTIYCPKENVWMANLECPVNFSEQILYLYNPK